MPPVGFLILGPCVRIAPGALHFNNLAYRIPNSLNFSLNSRCLARELSRCARGEDDGP
jgi:hypothetical protein